MMNELYNLCEYLCNWRNAQELRREGGKFCRKGAYKRSPPERPNSPGESFAVNFFHYVKWPGEHNKGSREEVNAVENLIDFLVAVGASIAGNYVSKWLDRHRRGR